MFRQIKSFVLVAITFGVVMSCSAPALAGKQFAPAERYKNDTVVTAKCLRKIVHDWTIEKGPRSDVFATCTATSVGAGYTVIKCTGGEVLPGGKARVSFLGTATSWKAEVISAKWYDTVDQYGNCTGYLDYAEPVPFIDVTQNGTLNVVVEHGAQEWTDPNGPPGNALGTIYGREVHYAITDHFRPLEDLNESLFTDPSITWYALDAFTLENLEDTNEPGYDLGALDEGDVVLFRFYTGASGTDTYELVQFCVREACIPAVSQWGVVVIALLLAAGGTIVIRRRRAMAT